MLGLYFLGPPLERVFGARRFLTAYTVGGVAANVILTLVDEGGGRRNDVSIPEFVDR